MFEAKNCGMMQGGLRAGEKMLGTRVDVGSLLFCFKL
jgi:hypothetical protein